MAERLRGAVAEMTDVTVSCGVATRGVLTDPSAMLARADEALYDAQAAGRNRVCVTSG
jgi:PleD family two-component response regulator